VVSIREERAAFEQLGALLRAAAAANARALAVHRGTAAGRALDQQLDDTLDRLAVLYGHDTYPNLGTAEIVEAAVGYELRLAAALDDPVAVAAARQRAQGLIDAARRGVRLHVREPAPAGPPYRAVYIEPLRQEFEWSLWATEEPYLRWRDGAVVIMSEAQVDGLRATGDEVDVLFLDPDELLDLDVRDDRPALEAELDRRLAAAREASDQVGDSPDAFVLRLLFGQSTVLRNLRDRLADGHPGAHEGLLPILAGQTAFLQERLAAAAAAAAVTQDPLGASIAAERDVQALAGRLAADPDDPARLRGRFQAVAAAGTHLAELERYHR
jgi:hypothetical protein